MDSLSHDWGLALGRDNQSRTDRGADEQHDDEADNRPPTARDRARCGERLNRSGVQQVDIDHGGHSSKRTIRFDNLSGYPRDRAGEDRDAADDRPCVSGEQT